MTLHLKDIVTVGLSGFFLLFHTPVHAATIEYDLAISQQQLNITGKPAWSMTVNGGIPGPTLRFREGDLARIRVKNTMAVDTSIHWHGLLVPPGMDGVPNISFPPISPGSTFTYEFPIQQSGTYWYHSHTSLQEQSGVYGSIVIEPSPVGENPDRDHVVLLSDWTDQNPHEVNRTLRRGSEWFALEKGSAQSIFGAARLGLLGDYFKRELQRMPSMDIADVAYDRFLANGKPESILPAKPHETVRLRIIDGSATTYFHLEFAGGPMTIVAADGQDVEPVKESRFLIAVAETYDVLIKVPASGAYEFRATAHDGSGYASVWIGSGERHPADHVPRPNLYHSMGNIGLKQIFALTPAGSMGMPDHKVENGTFDHPGMMAMHSMDMGPEPGKGSVRPGTNPSKSIPPHPAPMEMPDHEAAKGPSDHSGMMGMDSMEMDAAPNRGDMNSGASPSSPDMSAMDHHPSHNSMEADKNSMPIQPQTSRSGKKYGQDFRFLAADVSESGTLAVDGMDPSRPWAPYPQLRTLKPAPLPAGRSVREIRLTLDGDMERYVWFLNNIALSESDSIRIHKDEVVRFIMINRTMMHHPMHLHGHFFRVLNGQEEFSPLKHTVDVAPMSTTVFEFEANELGDWFFHCHLLYHMKAGMARLVHYQGYTPAPEVAAVRPALYKDPWYAWGQTNLLSNMAEASLTLTNTRNIVSVDWETGWAKVEDTESEGILTYARYINRFFSVFTGVDLLAEGDDVDKIRGVAGFRYLLPLNLESRLWGDTDGGARFSLGKSFELLPRLTLFGAAEYDTHTKWEGKAGLSYMISNYFSLAGQWHSDFGVGAGMQIRF
jgi:hypothetical protein